MGEWLNGFTIGLTLGTSVFSGVSALLRRRQLQALKSLLQSGGYRVLKADGSTATASELLSAIGGHSEPLRSKGNGKMAALVAVMFVVGLISAFVAIR